MSRSRPIDDLKGGRRIRRSDHAVSRFGIDGKGRNKRLVELEDSTTHSGIGERESKARASEMEENHVASSTLTRTVISNVHCTSPESGGDLSATDESFIVASFRVVERAHDTVDRLAVAAG
ncbi:unnamed protein product [Sphagnum tenellum]